ncbi:hypothetical protein KKC44_04840 [Patescibacteria group bacterium]|nr:hypothetical protein [Patescibacteria group bacterium]MBU2259902.1 hypothetical protein [Patescibacteria group bacterium]
MKTPQTPQLECIAFTNKASTSTHPFCSLQHHALKHTVAPSENVVENERFSLALEVKDAPEVLEAIARLQSTTLTLLVETLVQHAYRVGLASRGREDGFATITPCVFFSKEGVTVNNHILNITEDMRSLLRMIEEWIPLRTTVEDLMRQAYEHAYDIPTNG